MRNLKNLKSFNESDKNNDVKHSFSFTYEDLKEAFEEGGENMFYDDMTGYHSSETFEEWFDRWFNKKYK